MPSEATDQPAPRRALPHDWLALGLIGVLAVTLLPSWGWDQAVFRPAGAAEQWAMRVRNVFDSSVDQVVSFYLLPTIGLWVALRCGAIDLSVWGVAGLGGVLAAVLINAGLAPALAMACAVAAGLGVGAVNGLAVARTRLPSIVITLAIGAGSMLAAQTLAPAPAPRRAVAVPEDTFGRWLLREEVVEAGRRENGGGGSGAVPGANNRVLSAPRSPSATRMLLVAGTYGVTMVLLMVWGTLAQHDLLRRLRRARVFVGLAASGALAAAAGTFWLVEHNSAPVPTRLVGDLRVPAAALLAGGALLVGPRRTLLSGLFLPLSVFLATAWRQEIPGARIHGYAVQSALLAGMILSIGLGFRRALAGSGRSRAIFATCCGVACLGLVLVAAQALRDAYDARRLLHVVGIAAWLTAVAGMTITECAMRMANRRRNH